MTIKPSAEVLADGLADRWNDQACFVEHSHQSLDMRRARNLGSVLTRAAVVADSTGIRGHLDMAVGDMPTDARGRDPHHRRHSGCAT